MDRLSVKIKPIEHKIWQELARHNVIQKPILIAMSGGIDSVVLATVLYRLRRLHKCELILAHVHHGLSPKKSQKTYRDRAQKFVAELAKKYKLKFVTNKAFPKEMLRSEDDFRNFRLSCLERWQKKAAPHALLAFAHHRDDLMETQVLRLIRGVGPEGIVAMSAYEEGKIRPLLIMSRSEIEKYAQEFRLEWCEDPSNKNTDPLRNWLRQHWLPQLEEKSPGALKSLARSIFLLTEKTKSNGTANIVFQDGEIDRKMFHSLSREDKRSLLANFLRMSQIKNYTQGHIDEICKRLDNSRGRYTFTLLKHVWHVNTERVKAAKV